MSTRSARDPGALLEDAVAAAVLDELDRQRYTQVELQQMSGVKARTFANYFTARSRSIPTPVLAAVAEALGLTGSEVLRRAEKRLADLSEAETETLLAMGGRDRMLALRLYVRRPHETHELEAGLSESGRRVVEQARAERAKDAPPSVSKVKRPRRSA